MTQALPQIKEALLAGQDIDTWTYCEEMLIQVSRTYALTIKALGDPYRKPILLGYLFCRIADTYEDTEKLPHDIKIKALTLYKELFAVDGNAPAKLEEIRALCAPFDRSDDEEFLALYPEPVFTEYQSYPQEVKDIMTTTVVEMVDGMIVTVAKQEKQGDLIGTDSMEDLEQYCYYVAGTVGNLLTDLLAYYSPRVNSACHAKLSEDKIAFAEGLQLTNIIKDAMGDLKREVSFLPKDLAQKHGVDLAKLYLPEHRDAAAEVIKTLVIKATKDLNRALVYTMRIPKLEPRFRAFCIMPVLFAIKTLATAVERMDDLLDPEVKVKITRVEVGRTLSYIKWNIFSNHNLVKEYREDLSRIEAALDTTIDLPFKKIGPFPMVRIEEF